MKNWIDLINLLLTIIIILHLVSMLIFGLAQIEIHYFGVTDTWIHANDDIIYMNWWQQYIHAYYWSTSIMITVMVYYPNTIVEKIVVIFVMIGTCAFFAYSINSFGFILSELKKDHDIFQA